MSPKQLLDMIDLMIADLAEQGRTPRNIFLTRDYMATFQQACRESEPRVATKSSTSGIFRLTDVQLYNFESSGVLISSIPKD